MTGNCLGAFEVGVKYRKRDASRFQQAIYKRVKSGMKAFVVRNAIEPTPAMNRLLQPGILQYRQVLALNLRFDWRLPDKFYRVGFNVTRLNLRSANPSASA
jgi:hypothetical protein